MCEAKQNDNGGGLYSFKEKKMYNFHLTIEFVKNQVWVIKVFFFQMILDKIEINRMS